VCGVVGVVAPGQHVSHLTYLALYALQHRGQEAAGMAVSDGVQLTALDVDRLLTYTVMLRDLPHGKGAQVLMGTASIGALLPKDSVMIPKYPGATSVLMTEGEGGRTVTYAVAAQPGEVEQFYVAALKQQGFTRDDEGTFTRPGESVRVLMRALKSGKLAVVVTSERATAQR
jgi:hypothetical protein